MSFSTQTIPYFPPPPTASTRAKSRLRGRTTSINTEDGSITTPQPRPTPLQRSRKFLLPILLMLTLVILILALIYGYCVSSPKTHLTQTQLAQDASAELNASISSRDATMPKDLLGPSNINTSFPSDTNSTSNSTDPYASSQTHLSAPLLLYLLSTPLLLLSLFTLELVLSTTLPTLLTTYLPYLTLLFSHLLALLTLLITSTFWTICELPSPTRTALWHICPVKVRGHFMYSIHELSIAKSVIAWVLVLGLVWHLSCLVRGYLERRRVWRAGRTVQGHGHAEEVGGEMVTVYIMEEGAVVGAGEAREKKRKRDRVVRFLSSE